MNTVTLTVKKSIIIGVAMGAMLTAFDTQLTYAAIEPNDQTYYTTNGDGTITANTADESKKEINTLEIDNGVGRKWANAVKSDNNTIKVHMVEGGQIKVSSDLSTELPSQQNAAYAAAIESVNGGTVHLYGNGTTIDIYSAQGVKAFNGRTMSAAYGFWNSTGTGNTIVSHGDNLIINAKLNTISPLPQSGSGQNLLAILANTSTNSSITIGNGYQVTAEAEDLHNIIMNFANNESSSAGSSIVVGNNTKIDFKIKSTEYLDSYAYIAHNGTGGMYLSGNNNITFGDGTEVKITATGKTHWAVLAMNQLVNSGATANITFGDNTTAIIEKINDSDKSDIYGASNYGAQGTSTITFGDNTTFNFSATRAVNATASITYVYGAHDMNSQSGKITFGNNTMFNLFAEDNKGGAFGVYHEGSKSALAQFGHYTTINVSAKGLAGGSSMSAMGVYQYSTTNSKATFGDHTTINANVESEAMGATAAGAYLNQANGSEIKFGNNTTINSTVESGSINTTAAGTYLNQANGSTVEFGNNTTIHTAINAKGATATATGAYLYQAGSTLKFGDNTTIKSTVDSTSTGANAAGAYILYANNSKLSFGSNTVIDSVSTAKGGFASGIYLYGSKDALVEFESGTRITVYGKGTGTGSITAAAIYVAGYNTANPTTGTVRLKGDTYISVKSDRVAGAANSAYAVYDASYSPDSKTYINIADESNPSVGTGTVQLTGDVASSHGTIYIGLKGAASYLDGSIYQNYNGTTKTGKVVLFMDDGAKWNLKSHSYTAGGDPTILSNPNIALDTLHIGSNCQIDLTSDGMAREFTDSNNHNYRTLRSSNNNLKITGTGNTFIINSDVANNISDTIVVDSTVSGENYIKINYDPSLAAGGEITDLGKTKVVEQVAGGSFDGVFKAKSTVNGLNKYLPLVQQGVDQHWYLTGFAPAGASNTVQLIGQVLENNMAMAMQKTLNSDLSKRMGEIRDNPDNAGAWVKITAGENTVNGSAGQKYSSIQGGIDRQIKAERGSHFVGFAFEHTTAGNSYDIESAGGKGNANMFTLYNTWSGNDGQYYDIVAKVGKLGSKADILDEDLKNAHLDYQNWMTGVSFEYGVRKQLSGGAYWQPELQLAYSRLNGTNYSSTNGVNVDQESGNSLIARLGVTLGKKIDKNSSVYITTSILKEFLGKTNTHLSSGMDKMTVNTDMSSVWGEIVIGANTKINSKTDMYVQAATNIGGKVRTKWQAQAGFRWNW